MKKNIPSLPNPIKTKKSEHAGDSIDGDIPSPEEGETKQPGINFPIIGIGASAGGLEALELFLKNVPLGSNMAFIVIQHQDPKHIG
jgi:chemotaxis response regulator CheB